MAEAVFLVDIDAAPSTIRDALDSREGIVAWWTTDADVEPGRHLTLRFPEAPVPFDLRVDAVGDDRVQWTSVGDFPPHWAGTEIAFNLMDNPDASGSRVFFEHTGFAAPDPMLGHTAFTWANLMNHLKAYCETGTPGPFFDG